MKSYREFTTPLIDTLEQSGMSYAIGGSFASSIYGETRTTVDIDISIVLPLTEIQKFVESIQRIGYHTSFDEILDAIIHNQPFNILDPSSGYKADIFLFLLEPNPLEESILTRRRRITYDQDANLSTWLYSPEDVIVYKLKYYLLGRSEKHLRDIASMLIMQGAKLDYDYISFWAEQAEAKEIWNKLLTSYQNRTQ